MTPKEALEAIRKELQDRLEFPINLTPEYRLVNKALTELEALQAEHEALKKDVARLLKINRDLRPFIEELEALKKPPTVEEVCKALSEHLAIDVSYGAKQFYYTIENTECIMFVTETYGDGLWSINEYLPPHLITLIGRFYEGLEVKE